MTPALSITPIHRLSRMLSGMFRPLLAPFAVLVALGLLSGLFEVVGVGVLIPLFAQAVSHAGPGSDVFSQLIGTLFDWLHLSFSVRHLLMFIVGLFLLKAVALLLFSYTRVRLTATYEARTRGEIYRAMMDTSWGYLIRQKVGYVENVLMTDIGMVVSLLKQCSSFVLVFTSLLLYTIAAFSISSFITMLALAIGSVSLILYRPLILRTRQLARHQTKLNKRVAHFINEYVAGLKVIKTMAVGARIADIAQSLFDKLKQNRIRFFFLREASGLLMMPLGVIFICFIFAASYLRPDFRLEIFIASVYLVNRLFDYFDKVQGSLHTLFEAMPFAEHVWNLQSEIRSSRETDHGTRAFRFEQSMVFSHVSFSYPSTAGAIRDVSLTIPQGSFIGIIGPSGAGKTTLVDLLLRLNDPLEGAIFVDDIPLNEIALPDWRRAVGYVPQEIFLINATVEENIKFHRPLTDADMMAAARAAQIHDIIEQLPHGYQTNVGERGMHLSMGQRQRIALARVLAGKPSVLILDEATSSLDVESERLIQQALMNLRGQVTIIAIAHRLSTILTSDLLFVMEHGKIIERGDPRHLLADRESHFFQSYQISS